jgi:hypothetical protein
MKIEIVSEGDTTSPRSVKVVRDVLTEEGSRREELAFNTSTYTKTSDRTESVDPTRMFNEINAYWATRPQAELDTIWNVYAQSYRLFETQHDVSILTAALQKLVVTLFQNMHLPSIREWVVFKSSINVPATVHDSYRDNEMQDFRDRTYVRNDYMDLVAMTIAVRPMVPIWGEFIGVSETVTGSSHKEHAAFELLYHSNIVNSEPMERLRRYVQATIANSKDNTMNAAAILTAIGSTDLPDWVTALAVVRRLAIGEITITDDNSSIVSNIYQYIGNTLRSLDRKFGKPFGGKVTDKSDVTSGRGGGDEQSVSVSEKYKVKQEVADGEIVVLSVYTEDTYGMACKVDETIPQELVDRCLHCVKALENEPILRHHVTLVQWVLCRALPPRSGESLDKAAILRAMAVSQALLWHWQFYDLAALVTATPLPISTGYGYGSNDNLGRFPKDLMERLQQLYPHHQNFRGKHGSSPRQTNVGTRAIDKFQKMISPYDWRLHCHADLMARTNRLENTRKMVIPGDVHIQLAHMFLRIHQ